MDIVNEKANAILNEKNTKLSPDKLLNTTSFFDIVGAYDPNKFKIYSSKEDFMNNAPDDGTGVIYYINYVLPQKTGNSIKYNAIKILKTITLESELTNSNSEYWYAYTNSLQSNTYTAISMSKSPTNKTISITLRTDTISSKTISYTSADNITFTTNDLEEDTEYEYPNSIYFSGNMPSVNLIYGGIATFEGMVKKGWLMSDSYKIADISLASVKPNYDYSGTASEYTYWDMPYTEFKQKFDNSSLPTGSNVSTYYFFKHDGDLYALHPTYSAGSNPTLCTLWTHFGLNDTVICMNRASVKDETDYAKNRYIDLYKITDLDTFAYTKIQTINPVIGAKNSFLSYGGALIVYTLPFKMDTIPWYIYKGSGNNPQLVNVKVLTDDSDVRCVNYSIGPSGIIYSQKNVYGPVMLPTQFTASGTNDTKEDMIVLGKEGPITGDGSIWNDIPASNILGTILDLPLQYTSDSLKVYGDSLGYCINNDYMEDRNLNCKRMKYLKEDDTSNEIAMMKLSEYKYYKPETYGLDLNKGGTLLVSDDEQYVLAYGYMNIGGSWNNHLIYKDIINDEILFDETGWNTCGNPINKTLYIYKSSETGVYEWNANNSAMSKITDTINTNNRSFYNIKNNTELCMYQNIYDSSTSSTRLKIDFIKNNVIHNVYDNTFSNTTSQVQNIFNRINNTDYLLLIYIDSKYSLYKINEDYTRSTLYENMTFSTSLPTSTYMNSETSYPSFVINTNWYYMNYNGVYKIPLDGSNPSTITITSDIPLSSGKGSPINILSIYPDIMYYFNTTIDNNSYIAIFKEMTETNEGLYIGTYKLYNNNIQGLAVYEQPDDNTLSYSTVNLNFSSSDNYKYNFNGLDLISFEYTSTGSYNTYYKLTDYKKYSISTVADYDRAIINGAATISDDDYHYSSYIHIAIFDHKKYEEPSIDGDTLDIGNDTIDGDILETSGTINGDILEL